MRLGHRHGGEDRLIAPEALQKALPLLGRGRGLYRRSPQSTARGVEVDAGVAPRENLDHVGQPLIAQARSLTLLAIAGCQRSGTGHGTHGRVHEIDVIPRYLMLILIQLARNRSHHVLSHRFDHRGLLADGIRHFKFDHDSLFLSSHTSARPSTIRREWKSLRHCASTSPPDVLGYSHAPPVSEPPDP